MRLANDVQAQLRLTPRHWQVHSTTANWQLVFEAETTVKNMVRQVTRGLHRTAFST